MSTTPPNPDKWGPQVSWLRSAKAKNFTGPAILLFAAFLATAPQLFRGNTCGHDFDFHLVSWLDALQNWREAVFYPHWSASSNFGAGEPRFIFYPPISWMLGAALGFIFPWKGVPLAITCLFFGGTGLATRALARKVLPDGPATLAGCAAIFSGYALYTAYERSDFAELAGGFWIPLLLLLVFRDRNPGASVLRRAFDGSAAPLTLVLAGAWLSNAPLGVMASYLLATVALIVALLWRSWAPILRASAAVALGLGLSAFFLLPAAVEQRWVDIHQVIDDPGYVIENSWMFARHSNPALELHDIELIKISSIGATMLAVAFVGILICWLRRRLPGSRLFWLPLAILPLLVLFLQFPLSGFVWNTLPKLRFLQFPWRWLVVLQTPMAIFFAAAIWTDRPRRRALVVAACTLAFFAATTVAALNFFQGCDEEDAVWARLAAFRSGEGFEGTYEYQPPFADNSILSMDLPQACLTSAPNTALGEGSAGADYDWWPEQHSCDATFSAAPNPGKASTEHLRVDAVTPHAGYLVLRLRSYPAWQVRINNQLVDHLPERADGLIAVPVPQGAVNVTVDWTTTHDVWVSRWLTALALALFLALSSLERLFARPRLS